jgi:hypothetical protein
MVANRWLAAVAAALILPACGGGPGGNDKHLAPSDKGIETFPSDG